MTTNNERWLTEHGFSNCSAPGKAKDQLWMITKRIGEGGVDEQIVGIVWPDTEAGGVRAKIEYFKEEDKTGRYLWAEETDTTVCRAVKKAVSLLSDMPGAPPCNMLKF